MIEYVEHFSAELKVVTLADRLEVFHHGQV